MAINGGAGPEVDVYDVSGRLQIFRNSLTSTAVGQGRRQHGPFQLPVTGHEREAGRRTA